MPKHKGPVYNVAIPVEHGTTVVAMNDAFRTLLANFIKEVDEVEPQLKAFALALEDPLKSAQNIVHKLSSRSPHKPHRQPDNRTRPNDQRR